MSTFNVDQDQERYHGSFSYIPLKITGAFVMSGPQAVSNGGCPLHVAEIFHQFPDAQQVAISSSASGVVYSRMLAPGEQRPAPKVSYRFISEVSVREWFAAADIEILTAYKLANQYDGAEEAPWWLLKTPYGLIEVGWRKRVISMNWSDTHVREQVTKDNVTSELMYVHADSTAKVIQYLTTLGRLLKDIK